jgi:hypothetical protein
MHKVPVIIVVVQVVGAVKVYVAAAAAALETLRKKGNRGWMMRLQFYHQNWWKN